MNIVDLTVQRRETKGSRKARLLRRQGKIPAVLYGHDMTPMSLEVDAKQLYKVLHTKAGENVVINLKVQGARIKETTCLVKEIQEDPVTDHIAHVDFTVISLTEKITVKVPLITKNSEEAVGV
ncbi:MAG: 50S ribosomal protein L25, partial [Candidatus Omnitrophica bacterium]|nr:50S ribosomal protein L25 [Candidatus Omnitrophota bacterium]